MQGPFFIVECRDDISNAEGESADNFGKVTAEGPEVAERMTVSCHDFQTACHFAGSCREFTQEECGVGYGK